MTTPMKAYDMGRFQRIVQVDGERVTGKFYVSSTKNGTRAWVHAIDVTVWDVGKHSGRALYSNDLSAQVVDGEADLTERAIPDSKLADVQEVWDEMKAAIVAAAAAAKYDPKPVA